MGQPPLRKGLSGVVNVLDDDPDLARHLSPERLEQARRVARAGLVVVGAGGGFRQSG
jgi:hypothetical protein